MMTPSDEGRHDPVIGLVKAVHGSTAATISAPTTARPAIQRFPLSSPFQMAACNAHIGQREERELQDRRGWIT